MKQLWKHMDGKTGKMPVPIRFISPGEQKVRKATVSLDTQICATLRGTAVYGLKRKVPQ